MQKPKMNGKTRIDRREFLKLASGAAVAALAGCQTLPPPASAPAATNVSPTTAPAQTTGGTIRVLMYSWPAGAQLHDAVPEFEKATGLKVEWEELGFNDLLAKMTTELVTKSGRYDVFNPNNVWTAQLAATGGVEALDDMIAKSGSDLNYDDFLAAARSQWLYKGATYGIPIFIATYISVYRKDIFEQKGIKVPSDGIFTAEEWTKVAKDLTGGGNFGTVASLKPASELAELWTNIFVSAGGKFFDEKLNPRFSSEAGVATANFLLGLLPAMPTDALAFGHAEHIEGISRGNILTSTALPTGRISLLNDPSKSTVVGKLGFGMLPYKGLGPSNLPAGTNHTDGFGLFIPKDSQHKKEAWDFINWAVSKDRQIKGAEKAVVPTRKSVFSSPELLAKQPWLDPIGRTIEISYNYPPIPEWSEILDKIGPEFVGILSKQNSVQDGLARADSAVAQLLKDRGYQVGTWNESKLPWE